MVDILSNPSFLSLLHVDDDKTILMILKSLAKYKVGMTFCLRPELLVVKTLESGLTKEINRSFACDHFLRAVVGHRRFDCDKKESILSNWITVSDEAFAMLL